ncbi:alpha-L-rhamnosidase [Clostridium thermosuccinogenes]|uniref:alpha-L-rhamnosidase n=1 Tax=Clostridium thermosuccinogenes TaxID=84032 RepID=A0A2K2FFC5_9CLOT|nr:alpha-L-rhamnosidase [Pseudoclostridium thermosuccinogenes]AUS97594.1 alpha-L-rhamnosidase [Pseudoclostridium thermosuccinogenes]PNT97458.1 alpha-L-rhamnosidase [Pseudoclostridium thermosuccinogenes]PNT99490.1 alpha-L-rhamnosidase [Pseudoclostridium thermosuccinogenes]
MLKVKKLRCEYKKNPLGIDVLSPRFSWQLESDGRGIMQTAYQVQVSKGDDTFKNLVWDTGIVNSDKSAHIEYEGEALISRQRYYYRIMVWDNKGNVSGWSEPGFFETGLLDKKEWKAEWITSSIYDDAQTSDICPLLRKDFSTAGKVRSARVYATALGLYELYINGSRVSDHLFTPGWTSYNKRLQYQTYDVTEMLKDGNNAIGAVLGNGWYKGNLVWAGNKNLYGDKAALLLQLHVTYEDGNENLILSDGSWKTSSGPILMSEIYHGETYDARLEKEGWSMAGYDDSSWESAAILQHPKEILVAQENVPVRVIQEIKPINIINTPKGEAVLDFGQNMVGWVRFEVEGPEGAEVVLRHAEVLDKDGNFYVDNLRSAKQTIRYILKGTGRECYEPHFTFQGFRYVKIESYPGDIMLENFTGRVIHSDMETTGSFTCSNELVNQLQHNIVWGQKGNFLDVPTDCPQRDERLGWTGDAQMFIRTACFNMNVASFFAKWLRDLSADQSEEKGVPHVIPHVLDDNSYSSSAWGDAATICPWTIYTCYGDKRILEEQYESMKHWVEYIRRQGDDEYLWNTGFHFGDWLGLDSKADSYVGATPVDFIATAYYAYSTDILAKTAKVLGKWEDAAEYEELYKNIIVSFRKEFVTPNGRLASPTQTAHVLALMFNLVDARDRKRVTRDLVKLIEQNGYHLTTGFVGTPYLCHVLSQNGHNDIAYKLLLQTDYPSWLYQITKGATTIWEHWDGIKEDGSFWSKDMNSFNHYAYGSIGDWLYRSVAGINTDSEMTGYKRIHITPKPGPGLEFAEAKLESMYGRVESAWAISEDSMKLKVCIPANTTAVVVLPSADLSGVLENGKRLKDAGGITSYEQTDEGVRIQLGSGDYEFTYSLV